MDIFEIKGAPWREINLDSPILKTAKEVPTNNQEETLQLLVWAVQTTKPKIVWEFGPWMGHTSVLMALAAGSQLEKLYACDNFEWQDWMNKFNAGLAFEVGATFLPSFTENTSDFKGVIEGIQWNSDFGDIPNAVKFGKGKPNFVLFDFTRNGEDLEVVWKHVAPLLIPNSTVLVFNWVWEKSEKFFSTYAHQLKPIAQHGVAGAFLFIGQG